mgnify:CR=1 FL=1
MSGYWKRNTHHEQVSIRTLLLHSPRFYALSALFRSMGPVCMTDNFPSTGPYARAHAYLVPSPNATLFAFFSLGVV